MKQVKEVEFIFENVARRIGEFDLGNQKEAL